MKNHNRNTIGVSALLQIDLMAVANIQHSLVKRLDWRK